MHRHAIGIAFVHQLLCFESLGLSTSKIVKFLRKYHAERDDYFRLQPKALASGFSPLHPTLARSAHGQFGTTECVILNREQYRFHAIA